MINSKDNKKIKEIKKFVKSSSKRYEHGVFIIEGLRVLKEVPAARMTECYYSSDFIKNNGEQLAKLKAKHSGCKFEEVSTDIFKTLSDTVTPQGILGVVKIQEYSLEDIINNDKDKGDGNNSSNSDSEAVKNSSQTNYKTLVLLEDIQDPGNLGTIIRTSEAAGVDAVILTKGCADVYSPKVIRGTMGTIFRVAVITKTDSLEIINRLNSKGFETFAAALGEKSDLYEYDGMLGKIPKKCLIIGNEGNGLRSETIEAATRAVSIPMEGCVESLNAGIATAVILYEMKRQNGE